MTDVTPPSRYDPEERFVPTLDPDIDTAPDDDAPDTDPDPTPPVNDDVSVFEPELGGQG
jgi:hypothetical protein